MTGVHPIYRVRTLILLAVLGASLATFMYWDTFWTRLTKTLASSDEDPIPVCAVQRARFSVTVPAQGEITGLKSVPVQTPQTRSGGLTLAWIIPEGAFVKAGDPVVRFDSTEAELNLEKQQNVLAANEQRFRIAAGEQRTEDATLEIDIASARKDYEYSIRILPQDETIFSKWDIIEAKIDAAFAKERIDVLTQKRRVQARIARADWQILAIERNKAQAEEAIAQQTLDSLELASPVSGVVLYRRERGREPQIGDQCWRGQVLAEVADLESLQAHLYVLERDGGGLKEGKEVSVLLDSLSGRSFKGTLQSVAPLAQPLERNSPLRYFTCDARIQGVREYLKSIRPGMAVEAEIVLEKYDSCFVVPETAVTANGAENLVYIKQGEDFLPTPVEIAPGPHGQTVILNGVQDGMIIAVRNPLETRKPSLPDFGKPPANMDSAPSVRRGGRFR